MATNSPKAMPLPKKTGILYFEGLDVEAFLQNYEASCNDALYTEVQKCENIQRYCSIKERDFVKNLPQVINPTSFQDLKTTMIMLYGNNDR
jgi:hypothetical protein